MPLLFLLLSWFVRCRGQRLGALCASERCPSPSLCGVRALFVGPVLRSGLLCPMENVCKQKTNIMAQIRKCEILPTIDSLRPSALGQKYADASHLLTRTSRRIYHIRENVVTHNEYCIGEQRLATILKREHPRKSSKG